MKCNACGKEHDGSYGSGKFCGSYCSSLRHHMKEPRLKNCVVCGVGVLKNSTYPNRLVKCLVCSPKKEKKAPYRRPVYLCAICNAVCSKWNKKFCSNRCSQLSQIAKRNKEILASNGVGKDIRSLKQYLIQENGNVCSICCNSEWMNKPMPLVIDHINGRAKDNCLGNLRLVCGNCDMQLPTYKSKNKHSDRKRIHYG